MTRTFFFPHLFQALAWILPALVVPGTPFGLDFPLPIETPIPQTPSPAHADDGFPSEPSSVTTQIFRIVFPADTFSEALTSILTEASRREVGRLSEETGQVQSVLDTVLKPPEPGYFSAIASSGIRTAAALAPVLFVLRLALHHWYRLLGENDGVINVLGDWLMAGFSAAASGPFLDQIVLAGWWAAGSALGETARLAGNFISVATVANSLQAVPMMGRPSLFSAVLVFGVGMGGLMGMVGLAFAFAAAQAVLFILAVLAPVLAVLAVLPQMRWMRALWFKAVGILTLLPVAAGAIFKAAVVLSASFGGSGFVNLLIRLCWLWGAVGFLLSLAGVLGRFTLSTAVDSAGKLTTGVRSLVSVGMLAAGGGAAGGAAGRMGTVGTPTVPMPGEGSSRYAAAIQTDETALSGAAGSYAGSGSLQQAGVLGGPAVYSTSAPMDAPPQDESGQIARMYDRPADPDDRPAPLFGDHGHSSGSREADSEGADR